MRSKSNKINRWFAWYPVTAWSEHKCCKVDVWFEFVHRQKIGFAWNWVWEYTLIEKQEI